MPVRRWQPLKRLKRTEHLKKVIFPTFLGFIQEIEKGVYKIPLSDFPSLCQPAKSLHNFFTVVIIKCDFAITLVTESKKETQNVRTKPFSRIIVPKFPENFLLKGYPLIHLDLRYFFYTGA